MATPAAADRGCPILQGFDPLDPKQAADPYPWYAKAREEAPVFYMEQYELYAVTRHEDVLRVLRDPGTFSSANSLDYGMDLPPSIAAELGADYRHGITRSIVALDDPEHARRRKLLQPLMTRGAVRAQEPAIRQIANDLLDTFIDDGRAEIVSQFASPLVVGAITSMLGVPVTRTDDFRQYNASVVAVCLTLDQPESELVAHWRRVIDIDDYIRDLVVARRANPEDDLISAILRAVDEEGTDEPLTDQETLDEVLTFVVAGSDTTAIPTAHMLKLLIDNPEQLEEVRADRSLVSNVVEETMRLLGSVSGLLRYTTKDVEIGGVEIPAGAGVWVTLKSPNHDPAVFPEPDRFDIHRTNYSAHLAFGNGRHFCIGAPLARLEMCVALETVLDRIPQMRLAPGQSDLEYIPSFSVTTVKELQIEWER